MPIVEAHILEGYSPSDKSRLTSALTDAIRFVVPAPDEAITVMLHEYPSEAYARGGQHRQPAPALPDPTQIVRDYLAAMEARDLEIKEFSARAKAATDEYKAETDRIKATQAGMTPEQVQDIAMGTVDAAMTMGNLLPQQAAPE